MSTIPLSPAARTPSKNVERLLSLQKSAKHLTGADILSFAAEASAMKRMAMAPSDENREPNSHQVPKRLFDINHCSKSAAGFYSPDKTAFAADETEDADGDDSDGSDYSGSDEDEEDAEPVEATATKHFEQIISIVNHNAQKRQDKAEQRQQATRTAQAASVPVPTTITAVAPSATASGYNNDFGESDAPSYGAELHDAVTDHSVVEATSSQGSGVTSTGLAGPAGIRELVVAHIMSVLNTGTYEEILSLHGIGQVRALRLLTVRNAGHVFTSLEDLQDIGMNDKTIEKFLKSNAAAFVL